MRRLALALLVVVALSPVSVPASAQQEVPRDQDLVVHPLTAEPLVCSEHARGESMDPHLGNALGTDCLVVGTIEREGREQLLGFYEGDGLENEDYFGWREALLAPFDGVVASVRPPAEPNRPGVLPEDPAEGGRIEFRRHDGARVIFVHVREIAVQEGDSVSAGDVVARLGNNGSSRAPHVHVGAWRDETPLQIRFDLGALGEIRGLR